MRHWPIVILLVVVFSGCTAKPYPDPIPPYDQGTTANHLGNWSLASGSFYIVLTHARMDRFDASTGEVDPIPRCTALFTWGLDEANQTVFVNRNRALHPSDPGPLRVLFLSEIQKGENCRARGPFGVNEGTQLSPLCFEHPNAHQLRTGDDWECFLPIQVFPPTGLGDDLESQWLHASVELDPQGFTATFNGHEVSPQSPTATFTQSTQNATFEVRTTVTARVIGPWPYGAVDRA